MKIEKTSRGFVFIRFKDRNGVECSLQQSSIATEDRIWLGCQEADPIVLTPGLGWAPVKMPEGYIANTRMHLNREQVKEILPYLQKFVETGELE